MPLFTVQSDALLLSMLDVTQPLSTCSKHGFPLDDAQWPSVEHYFQGMRFEDPALRAEILASDHPHDARKLGQKYRRKQRRDWSTVDRTFMNRGLWTKVQAHADVREALLATGERQIVENSQYDYYWGCGRDTRGDNHYGRLLMAIRERVQASP